MTGEEATWRFVDEHLKDDVRQLALKKSKYNDIDFEFALRQIQGRQKTRDKLPFLASIPRFVFPPSLALEQCSSEIMAKYKRFVITDIFCRDARPCVSAENDTDILSCRDVPWCVSTEKNGKTFADLTGGFGVDSLSLSPLFETCHYVEPQQQLCDIMAYNSKLLQLEHIQIHQTTMEDFIQDMQKVDLIYVDPSRRDAHGSRVVGLEDCTPNILMYKDLLLKKGRRILLKLSPMLDVKRSLAQLPNTSEVHVLAVNGECKELLFLMGQKAVKTVKFHAVNVVADKLVSFDFTADEEANALPEFATEVDSYLYEPNAAIMKAGGFKCLSTFFHIQKLHPHSHLYTSESKICDFPGRAFRVREVLPLKQAQTALKDLRQANVAVRNFPLTAEELKKKLKLTDGGEVYIFGTTLEKDRKLIVICSKEKQNQKSSDYES
ncbi:MAG: SAM-dependent methyltransferase [Bacteroidales bacterium]|nr:SAM-dependent methyltransferase [Bacteroidales bacterium]